MVVGVPSWPRSAEEMKAAMATAIAHANGSLNGIGAQTPTSATFRNTVVALDDAIYEAAAPARLASVISSTNTDPLLRAAAENAGKSFDDWRVGIDYRADVYAAIKAFATTRPPLAGEDRKLLEETLRDYRRAGLELPLAQQAEVARRRKELAAAGADFEKNIEVATAPVVFHRAELEGVPENWLAAPGVKTGEDSYTLMANLEAHYGAVEDNARREETRRKFYLAHDTLAKKENVAVLNRMLTLRNQIALRLGYRSWADYQTEVRMVGSGAKAERFVNDLIAGLEPEFRAEVATLQKMKVAETKNPAARLCVWDWRYYTNERKEVGAVDAEALRKYFPYEKVRDGMFAIYGKIFGLKFRPVAPPGKWADRLELWSVSDANSGDSLGLVYLDLFTHPGKLNASGAAEAVGGKLLPNGKYERPVAAVLLAFTPAAHGPALLLHSEVEILFHEFDHALHTVLTRAKYSRFAGTSVPLDFVEAPSQMLQYWVWDPAVLAKFAAETADPSRRIPPGAVAQMRAAKLANAGIFYRRQMAFAALDLALHAPHPEDQPSDCVGLSNRILEKVFLPIDPAATFVTAFRALDGYDAGYYGYAWADSIAADMATVFENAPDGYLDAAAGMRLRREIYEQGGARDVEISVEKFLGRKLSLAPFLKKLALTPK